ncbi:MAG: IS200/IS605 family accessory protein TnpB-related protein [Pleurocapsa sp. MO_226.B13]|nr:IS200/IS605 family accessory protein TnpB-related protein [Pleurocapsa sp. MO_226.B13]
MPTYQTLLPDNIYSFLTKMSELYSAIEKDMHVALIDGGKIETVEKIFQSQYKVDSTTVRNVYHDLKGKHKGIKELRKTQAKSLKSTIKSIKAFIKKKSKKKTLTAKDKFNLHQKKRRLAIKEHKLKALESKRIKLCFGTKKLFKAQYHLKENGYDSHDEWLHDWRKARTSSFMMVGAKTYASGNQLCRLTTEGELKITVPPCLLDEFGTHVRCEGINFRYGQAFVDIALTPVQRFSTRNGGKKKASRIGTERAVTHRFVSKGNLWYLHTTVELPDTPWISHRNNGALGIDLNVDSIAWAYCDKEGNLKDKGQVRIDLEDKSSKQTSHLLSMALAQVLDKAVEYECPIVIEKLDFTSKKSRLREYGKRYARMLSQFAYSKFADLVQSKAQLSAIQVISVNPAYSSLIGMVKYMSLYGLNSGTSAALVLARRCLRFSERLPRVLYALLSPVDDNKHVWSYWARISKIVKGCHRHSFFEMRVRVGVKFDNQSSVRKGKLTNKLT